MKIIVRGVDIKLEDNYKTLGELFDLLESNDCVALKVVADGEDITNYTAKEIKEIEPIAELEVVANSVKDLLISSFLEAEDYLPRLIEGIEEIISKFAQDKENEALNLLKKGLEGFDWLNDLLKSLPLLEEKLDFKLEDYSNLNQKWQENIKELYNGFQNQDGILINDILEYELIPVIKNYLNLIKEINQKNSSRG